MLALSSVIAFTRFIQYTHLISIYCNIIQNSHFALLIRVTLLFFYYQYYYKRQKYSLF